MENACCETKRFQLSSATQHNADYKKQKKRCSLLHDRSRRGCFPHLICEDVTILSIIKMHFTSVIVVPMVTDNGYVLRGPKDHTKKQLGLFVSAALT